MLIQRARFLIPLAPLLLSHCLPGGVIDKGGFSYGVQFIPEMVRSRGAPYRIICAEKESANQADKTAAEKDAHSIEPSKKSEEGGAPPRVRYVNPADYRGGCEETGRHSIFYLFNLFPVTPTLNPEYAITEAIQRVEGSNMIRIRVWHEIHYYSLLGKAVVFYAKGDVIQYTGDSPPGRGEKRRGR